MKKVLLTILLVVVSIIAFAKPTMVSLPLESEPIMGETVRNMNGKNIGYGLFYHNSANARSIIPSNMPSIAYDSASGYIQAVAGVYDGTQYHAVHYRYSTNGGATWSAATNLFSAYPSDNRALNSMAIADGGYPYVTQAYRPTGYRMILFTTDAGGPGGGAWTSPVLTSDTVNYKKSEYQTVAVNAVGDKVCIFNLNFDDWSYGINTSSDYGETWGTYSTALLDPYTQGVYGADIGTIRWLDGDNVVALMGTYWDEDSVIADSTGRGISMAMAFSSDGGNTWGNFQTVFGAAGYNGGQWPFRKTLSGDTITFWADTSDNNVRDEFEVKAYIDRDTAGTWVDELGWTTGAKCGTWWHRWNATYYDGVLYTLLPMFDLTIDYYETDTMLVTLVDQWINVMYGTMNVGIGETEFDWTYMQLHVPPLYNGETGDFTYTSYQGYVQTSNIVVDPRTPNTVYLLYGDYDIDNDIFTHDLIKIVDGVPVRAVDFPVPGAGIEFCVEAPAVVDENGLIHTIYQSSIDTDSVYYVSIDVDAITDWDSIPYEKSPDGIELAKNETKPVNTVFNVPSMIKGAGEISFTIKENSNVKISLFDITGREVGTLVNGVFNAGNHSVKINANNFANGIYFAKINSGNTIDTRKIIIVK